MELSADIGSLGVHMDGQLNMNRHLNSVCSSCYYHIKALVHIRLSLNHETAANIGRSVISSSIDYCNSSIRCTGSLAQLWRSFNECKMSWFVLSVHWSPTWSALASNRIADHLHDHCTSTFNCHLGFATSACITQFLNIEYYRVYSLEFSSYVINRLRYNYFLFVGRHLGLLTSACITQYMK